MRAAGAASLKALTMFKVTIREAILMTTIVAVLLMWRMERNQNAKNEARYAAAEARRAVLEAWFTTLETNVRAMLPPRRTPPSPRPGTGPMFGTPYEYDR